jgi:hypothetical protein
MLIIIVICLILLSLVPLYFYLTKTYNWFGFWSSDMNPDVTFKITSCGKNLVDINGEKYEVRRNKLLAYGLEGKIRGEQIFWQNGNIWHKILAPLPPPVKWFDIWYEPKADGYMRIFKDGETVYIEANSFLKIPATIEGNKIKIDNNVFGIIEGDKLTVSETSVLNRAQGLDPNISIFFYNSWVVDDHVYKIKPNLEKKGVVNVKMTHVKINNEFTDISNNTEVYIGEINGNNIKLTAKDIVFNGILGDRKINWDRTKVWNLFR